jgi:hypothetical protein
MDSSILFGIHLQAHISILSLTNTTENDNIILINQHQKGDFMKKILLIIVLCAIGIFIPYKPLVYAQPAQTFKPKVKNNLPAFNKPNSFVFDSNTASGNLEDKIRLNNHTTRSDISFTVYLYDSKSKTWKVYGTGKLKGSGDTDFVDSKLSGELKNYRYYAIQALDKRNYKYTFEKKRNDLYIYIYDK